MVMTLMPMGARSRAMGRVIPTMPPLEAEYAAWPTWREEGQQNKEENRSKHQVIYLMCVFNSTCPSKAATLAVLMMQPRCPSASGSFFPISPTARRITLKVPPMFTGREHKEKSSEGGSIQIFSQVIVFITLWDAPLIVKSCIQNHKTNTRNTDHNTFLL